MQVLTEFDIRKDCWSGAKDRIENFTDDLLDQFEEFLETNYQDIFGEQPTATDVNDLIWFEDDTYADWLGFRNAEQLWDYCDLIKNGADEDEIWEDSDGELHPEGLLLSDFDIYMSENPDWADDYDGFEDWAEDNGYEKFEI